MDDGHIVLTFSELVRPDSFDATGITLYASRPFDADASKRFVAKRTLADSSTRRPWWLYGVGVDPAHASPGFHALLRL